MNQTEDDTTMKSEYYPDIEKKDLFKQGYIGDRFHHRFLNLQAFEGTQYSTFGQVVTLLLKNCYKQQGHLILVVQQLI